MTPRKKPEELLKRGRPSDYTPELAARICRAIAKTHRGLAFICNNEPDFPTHETVLNWKLDFPEFFQQYLTAKEAQCSTIEEFAWENLLTCDVETSVSVSKAVAIYRATQWKLGTLAPKIWGGKNDDNATFSNEEKADIQATIDSIKQKHQKEY